MKKRMIQAMLAMALAASLLFAGCGILPGLLPPASEGDSTGSTSKAQVIEPSSNAPTSKAQVLDPESTSEPESTAYTWVKDPYFECDIMMPLFDYYHSGTKQMPFVDYGDGTLWGLMSFDGDVIFEPYEEGPAAVCGDEHAHGLPYDIEMEYMNGDDTYATLSALGFPYEYWGGHGVGGMLVYYYFVDTGEYVLYGGSEGPPSPVDSWGLDYDYEATLRPVVPYIEIPSGVTEEDLWDPYTVNMKWVYGLLRTSDKERLLPPEYQINSYHYGYYPVQNDAAGLWGYFDVEGERLITECVYDMTWTSPNGYFQSIGFFYEGLCPVSRDGKYGFIDPTGAEVIPPQFDGATHVYEGKAWVKQDGLWGQIDLS